MDRVPSGKLRKDAANLSAVKLEAALTSREEAAKLRRRLLKMIVDNELKRRTPPSTTQV